jgi:hypothetical protein
MNREKQRDVARLLRIEMGRVERRTARSRVDGATTPKTSEAINANAALDA